MIIFLIILAVIAILLLIPVRFEIVYNKDELQNDASVVLKYAFIKYTIYPEKPKKSKKKHKTEAGEKTEEVDEKSEKPENAEKKEIKYKKEHFSFEEKKAELEGFLKLFKELKHEIVKILSYTLKHAIVIDNITFHSEFGFDDAMQTGIFTGIYNGAVYSVIGVIHHNAHLRTMDIKLQPNFEKKCFGYRFSCIARTKTVHIIIITFKVLILLRKIKKLMNGAD